MSEAKQNGQTDSDADVDIDAGNLMVEKIKPLVRSTRRPLRESAGRCSQAANIDRLSVCARIRCAARAP